MNPAMIGAKLLGLVLPADTARKFAPWGFALACILALLAVWGTFKLAWPVFDWFNDREAVAEDRAEANAEFTEKQLKAERDAGANKRARDAADAQTQKETDNAIDQADRDGRSAADDLWNGGLFDAPDEKR